MIKVPQIKNNVNEIIKIKNSGANTAEIYFYGDIVSDSWGAWTDEDQYPDNIKNLLKEHEGKNLDIFINSGGGSVFAGIAIYNILKRHSGYKTVHVDGIAASVASVIALAGDRVIIPKNAFFMIHKPWSRAIGNANDLRKEADVLDTVETSILNIYEEHLCEGVSRETIAEMVNEETWLTGEQAAEYFNVEVGEEQQIAACADLSRFKNAPKNITVKAAHSHDDKQNAAKAAKIKSLCISALTKGV